MIKKIIRQKIYEDPKVEIVELRVEQGFAESGGGWHNEDEMSREDINDWF